MFKIYCERSSPNQGACYRYMVNRNYQIGGGVSKICGIIYGEPESPNEGACLRCDEPQVLARLRLQMRDGGGGCALANAVPSRALSGHVR